MNNFIFQILISHIDFDLHDLVLFYARRNDIMGFQLQLESI